MRAAICVLLTGCARILGFEEVVEPSPDGRVDGPVVDGFVDTPQLACPASYTLTFQGSSYRIVTMLATQWLSANATCVEDGSRTHLIVLSSDAELSAIRAQALDRQFWIGLSDRRDESVFLPVTNEPTIFPPPSGTPWGNGQPADVMMGADDCVELSKEFGQELETVNCGSARNFICECDAFEAAPGNF